MPHEVIVKVLLAIVAIAVVGIATTVILYYAGIGAVKAEVIIERLDLRKGGGVLTIRNVSNVKMLDITRFELQCSSKTFELDKNMIPLPMPPGGSATVSLSLDLNDGDECRLFIQAVGEGGYGMAASSALIPVRSI
jgi:hypothetical protein